MVNTYSSLFIGYSIIWGILSLYILSLGKRLRKLEERIEHGEEK